MSEINFVDTDTAKIYDTIIQELENGVAEPLYPGDERRIFGEAMVPLFAAMYASVNDACRQKMLRYARGEVLDAIGENRGLVRIDAQHAKTTLRFFLNEAISNNVTIPSGTKVTSDFERYFETDETVVIEAGNTYVDVSATASAGGGDSNSIPVGAINIMVDLLAYIDGVQNLDVTSGGGDVESDDAFRDRIRAAINKTTTAGPAASYRYWAMQADPTVSDAIVQSETLTLNKELDVYDGDGEKCAFLGGNHLRADTLIVHADGSSTAATVETDYTVTYSDNLLVITLVSGGALESETTIDVEIDETQENSVLITPILYGGEIPSAEILAKVLESCSGASVRPLTDHVIVAAPNVVNYDIELTYYTTPANEGKCIETIEGSGGSIDQYIYWQGSALNRDINPDYLRKLILSPAGEGAIGADRVTIVKPVFSELNATDVAKWSGSLTVHHIVKGD